eukprot:9143888-Pyramimonas_sp.AAC.1
MITAGRCGKRVPVGAPAATTTPRAVTSNVRSGRQQHARSPASGEVLEFSRRCSLVTCLT